MLEFEALGENNIDEVTEIEKLSFSVPWSRDAFAQLSDNPLAVFIVARRNKTAVGYASMYCVSGEGQINNIAVHPDFRGEGIGDALLSRLLNARDDIKAYFLEVRVSNTAAVSLYRKHGFEVIAQRKNYYRRPTENALIMAKEEKSFEDFSL